VDEKEEEEWEDREEEEVVVVVVEDEEEEEEEEESFLNARGIMRKTLGETAQRRHEEGLHLLQGAGVMSIVSHHHT
jgi:hypothetical protein